jgi:pimeloyl-ACP methyl ester carboxylesterase
MLYFLDRKFLHTLFITFSLLFALGASAGGSHGHGCGDSQVKEFTLGDRTLEVWSWGCGNRGVILFSHGFGFAPWKYTELYDHWVDAGFKVYAPLHVDSTDHPNTADYSGLYAPWVARLEDMEFLAKKYGKKGYIAAGHSFGALTALAKGGVETNTDTFEGEVYDDNAELVLAFSPPAAIPGFVETYGYAELRAPALIQTGTNDVFVPGDSYEGHLDAYNYALAEGNRYALVFEGVDHYFGGVFDKEGLDVEEQIEELNIAAEISLLMVEAYVEYDYFSYLRLQWGLSDELPLIFKNK